jgi:L-histidine Nalpha-methyltransferase
LVEFGSGSIVKTRILLDHLLAPAAYVPLDIARTNLLRLTMQNVGRRIGSTPCVS